MTVDTITRNPSKKRSNRSRLPKYISSYVSSRSGLSLFFSGSASLYLFYFLMIIMILSSSS